MFDLKSLAHSLFRPFFGTEEEELDKTEHRKIEAALDIAEKNLKHCYSEKGIQAGTSHFSDLWVRDACFASFGAIEIEDATIVRESLSKMAEYISDDGQVPFRIGDPHFVLSPDICFSCPMVLACVCIVLSKMSSNFDVKKRYVCNRVIKCNNPFTL